MINYLLPIILSKVKSPSADIRFLSLVIFQEIIIQYVGDDSIYDVKGGVEDNGSNVRVSTKQINDLIVKSLMPLFGLIFSDNDPMPLKGL
jgi:hypothetical protein